ncbi:retrotransposable element Tf2 [Tanacetum coccineum]
MRSLANKNKSDRVFEVGIVGAVAYKLDLPPTSQIHHVFHVSQLKLCKGSSNKMGILPHCRPNGLLSAEPIAILDSRVAVYVLMKWSNHTDEDATWELYSDLIQSSLILKKILEDKNYLKKEGLLQCKVFSPQIATFQSTRT